MKITEKYLKLKERWNEQAKTGEIRDEDNPLFLFQLTKTSLLNKIIEGKLDAKQLAQMELSARNGNDRNYYVRNSNGRKLRVTIPS